MWHVHRLGIEPHTEVVAPRMMRTAPVGMTMGEAFPWVEVAVVVATRLVTMAMTMTVAITMTVVAASFSGRGNNSCSGQ